MKTVIYLLLSFLVAISLNAADISGTWTGNLSVQGMNLKLNFNIEKNGDLYSGTMDSPSQGAYGIKASKVEVVESEVLFEVSLGGIVYKGIIEDDFNIKGNFMQGGQQFELNLTKSMEKSTGPNRPQNPKKPYPYISKDVSFKNETDNILLKGTLTLPEKGSKFPAVVLVSGSGAQNRDEEIMSHKPFLVISDFLTRNGIAVLRYDDRGTAESEGDYSIATTYDFVNDAKYALEFLKLQPEIDKENIGIIGHSEGGVIAPIIASKDNQINYIVMLAGPVLSGKDLMILQKYKIEEQMGVPKEVLEKNSKIFREAYDILTDSNLDLTSLQDSLSKHFDKAYSGMLPSEDNKSIVQQITNVWWKSFIALEPSKYIKNVKTPILALFGSKDLQVPAQENIELLEKLREDNKLDVQIKQFDNLNHLFQECNTGMPNEYAQIEQTISPDVLEYIKNWILKQKN